MDTQKLINILFGIVIAFGGWWTTTIWTTVQQQQQQISQLNVELAKNYVPRVELQATFNLIFAKLDEIQRGQRGGK